MWCLTTWLGHPGNHGISNTPAITTIWFVSHPKVKSFPDEYKFMYTSILYCWCVGNSVISHLAQPGGEAPHLEDKKIMFGNNQLLQVDFIRPSSTTCFPSQGWKLSWWIQIYVYIYLISTLLQQCLWWMRVVWNQLEGVDHSQTLSSKCGASPPGWATREMEITEFPTHQQ